MSIKRSYGCPSPRSPFGQILSTRTAVQERGRLQRQEPQARGCSPVPGGREAGGSAGSSLRLGPAASEPPHSGAARAPPSRPRGPRRPAPSPARPPAHRHLCRPVAGDDRHVGVRVGKLPLFHVASFQRHLPAARRVRRALPAGGGKARSPRSGAPVRAAPRRLRRPQLAAP